MTVSPEPLRVRNGSVIRLPKVATPDGCLLSFGEVGAHIPFEIKRFYYIYNFAQAGIRRGGHSHRSFEQVFFCVDGRFLFHLDDGLEQEDVWMDDPSKGVYVGPRLWHDMLQIEPGSIILVVASHPYEERDYVRDYAEFRRQVAAGVQRRDGAHAGLVDASGGRT